MGKAKDKKEGKSSEIADLIGKIAAAAAKSAQLKKQVEEITAALSELAATNANISKVRQEEKALFDKNQPEMEGGLEGVWIALKTLRDYYQNSGAKRGPGAASGIVGILEVVESDFVKSLSEMTVEESTAAADYEKEMKEAAREKVRKEQDIKYKTQEYKRIDAELTELNTDPESLHAELAAIDEFFDGLKAECIEPPESFAAKLAKAQEEIDGLKEGSSGRPVCGGDPCRRPAAAAR
ncbi:unnamed protein product, partial [Polarella glacialis]